MAKRKICIICNKPKTNAHSGANPIELDYQEVHFDCWFPTSKKGKELKQKAIKMFKIRQETSEFIDEHREAFDDLAEK